VKIELSQREAVRLHQIARGYCDACVEEGAPDALAEFVTDMDSVAKKLRGALERAGCRIESGNDWKLPARRK
jgi:hypothetical protein